MIWKYLLRIWGWVCLLAAALHGAHVMARLDELG